MKTKDFTLHEIVYVANLFKTKQIASSDNLIDFRQTRKRLDSKGLTGWVVMQQDKPLAFNFPKAFNLKNLDELAMRIEAGLHQKVR